MIIYDAKYCEKNLSKNCEILDDSKSPLAHCLKIDVSVQILTISLSQLT